MMNNHNLADILRECRYARSLLDKETARYDYMTRELHDAARRQYGPNCKAFIVNLDGQHWIVRLKPQISWNEIPVLPNRFADVPPVAEGAVEFFW